MASQRILPFPCRKSRVLGSKLDSPSNRKSPQKLENSLWQRPLISVSNLPARSIMLQPKSPRKRYGDPTENEGWTNDDLLNEIFKLSPCSPVKGSRESAKLEPSRWHKTPTKKPYSKTSTDMMSPTRDILSPVRALSLNSPQKTETPLAKTVDSKTAKVLRLKLAKIDLPAKVDAMKLPPDETPTRPTRNRGKTVSFSMRQTSRRLMTGETPQKEDIPRRVTRSAKKAQKSKLLDEFEDDYKENVAPGTQSPSPSKMPKPSPEKKEYSSVRRNILLSSPEKPKTSPKETVKTSEKTLARKTTPKKSFQSAPEEEKPATPRVEEEKPATPRVRRVLQLHRPDALVYQQTKHALHSSVPDELVGRETEIAQISNFISSRVKNKKSGSLYISGAPGTGKSACLTKVIGSSKVTGSLPNKSKVIAVNCMSMRNSTAIYSKIATELGAKPLEYKTVRLMMKYLETALTSDGPTVILLLDEMDQLDSKNQEVLYTIFEWPALQNSRLVLIGIANALDLTDRILPRLQSRTKCKPTLMNFQPYSKDQLVAILEGRIKQTSTDGERVIDTMAVQFCARKVSAVAGDARKALDICRRAVEAVENNIKSQHVLLPSGGANGVNPPSHKVGPKQIAGVLSGVYESSISAKISTSNEKNNREEEEGFPLQQKLAICTLVLLTRHIKCQEVTLGKLHESYAKVCKRQQVTAVGQSEFSSLLQLVGTRGIISTKRNKQMRMSKVSLALQEKDVEYALQDQTLLSAILREGLPK